MEFGKALQLHSDETIEKNEPRRRYRVVGVVMFGIAIGLLLMRIIVGNIPVLSDVEYIDELLTDTVFTFSVQIGVLFLMPLLVYRYVLKMNYKEVFAFSNFKNTQYYNYIIAIVLGFLGLFVTIGISTFWQVIISMLGYNSTSAASALPEKFNPLLLISNIILVGVLPGICEEFAIRGGFLTTMKSSFKYGPLLVIMAITFGLFHQYITQVFYTACFGFIMALIVIKTGSIYPAIIIHFINNSLSVYLDFADRYDLPFGNFYDVLQDGIMNNGIAVFGIYLLIVGVYAGLVVLLVSLNSHKMLEKKLDVVAEAGFDHTNNRIVLVGQHSPEEIRDLGLDKAVFGQKLEENRFNPTIRDNAFYIGAIVVTVLSTLASFVWGLMV